MPLLLKLITLLMLPITLTSCAKAQGALAPTGDKYEGYGAYLPDRNQNSSDGFLPDLIGRVNNACASCNVISI